MNIDFQEINAHLLQQLPSLLAFWLPDGKREGSEWIALNPTRNDRSHGSFRINLTTGKWCDFATSDSGGDPISLYAYLHGISQGHAAKELAPHVGITVPRHVDRSERSVKQVMIVPNDAPPLPRHGKFGLPSHLWRYHDADGQLLGYIVRFDTQDGKEIMPLTWSGTGWQWTSWGKPRPLYGLDRLNARPDAVVLMVEGEKAADAAQTLLPQLVAVTWPGGCKAVKYSDFTPLEGRRVILWPDNDQPGIGAMLEVATALRPICDWVKWCSPPSDATQGWDLADANQDTDWSSYLQLTLTEPPQMQRAIRQMAELDVSKKCGNRPDLEDPVNDLLTQWVFVSAQRKFVHKPTMRVVDVEAFNLEHLHLMVQFPEHEKKKPAEYLRRIYNSEVVHDLMYLPTMWNGDPIFRLDGVRYLNTYNDISVPSAAQDWQEHDAWQICLNHLQNIIPDEWHELLAWMAHNIQHPGKKILWAPLIVGMPGDGKTTIINMLTAAMGHKHAQIVGPEAINSDFNNWAEGKCLAAFEEIRVKGHSRHEFMNKLKTLITNDIVDVVAKGKNSRNVTNTQNYIALSNFRDALALDPDDRRWGVFFTRFKSREEVLREMDKAYWTQLIEYAIRGNPGVIRGWLMSIDLTKFDRNESPRMTEAKRFMIENSLSDDAHAIELILQTGAKGVSLNVVETASLNAAIQDIEGRKLRTKRISTALAELKFEMIKEGIKWDGRKCRIWTRLPFIYDGSPVAKHNLRQELGKNTPTQSISGYTYGGK